MNTDTRDAVHTLADLHHWKNTGPSLAVVGKPVSHSLSPIMHHAALAVMAQRDPALKAWRYHKFELAPEQLPEALPKFHTAGFVGLNFTVPHKEVVLALANRVSPFARAAGAANTLHRTAAGWHAHNTDGPGLSAALRAGFDIKLEGQHVILLGAGGAGRAAAMQCLNDRVASLSIGNRSRERLDALLRDLATHRGGSLLRGFDLSSPPRDLPQRTLVINATSAGLAADAPPPIDIRQLPKPRWVYDMIYNPPETPLLRDAQALGIAAANGLSMLVHQGAQALRIWTGHEAPADVMQQALQTALAR